MADSPSIVSGELIAEKQQFAIVASRFNEFVTGKLLEGALDALRRHGCPMSNVTIVWVPGAWEIPLTAKKLADSNKFASVICLGAVVRGATPHFDHVCTAAARGIAEASMGSGVPVIFGILTTDTLEDAINRAGAKSGNKGFDAAMSAIEMSNVFAKLDGFVSK